MALSIAKFIKMKRKEAGLTQEQFADKAGVALTVVRKMEQGKENLSLTKVNQVLMMFGNKLALLITKKLKNEIKRSFLSKDNQSKYIALLDDRMLLLK